MNKPTAVYSNTRQIDILVSTSFTKFVCDTTKDSINNIHPNKDT
jgi:hypothetical protein